MLLLRKNKYFINGFTNFCHRNLSEVSSNAEINESTSISRNKSGLLNHHRNMLHNNCPYTEPNSWIHLTEKYQRKVYGRYGAKSGVSAKICFSTKYNKFNHYDKLSEPETIQTMINKYKIEENAKMNEILKRENEITKKLENLNKWKQELSARIHKKEADAIAAKERKDRLIEEVRRHFGYKIDPKDERFKEVLEQKEKEDKKNQKEAKRKAKEQKLMTKLIEKSAS